MHIDWQTMVVVDSGHGNCGRHGMVMVKGRVGTRALLGAAAAVFPTAEYSCNFVVLTLNSFLSSAQAWFLQYPVQQLSSCYPCDGRHDLCVQKCLHSVPSLLAATVFLNVHRQCRWLFGM
ncbi:TPA: hypothetical protein ACH3X1_014846 [Trebouxia sp. C0004]